MKKQLLKDVTALFYDNQGRLWDYRMIRGGDHQDHYTDVELIHSRYNNGHQSRHDIFGLRIVRNKR